LGSFSIAPGRLPFFSSRPAELPARRPSP